MARLFKKHLVLGLAVLMLFQVTACEQPEVKQFHTSTSMLSTMETSSSTRASEESTSALTNTSVSNEEVVHSESSSSTSAVETTLETSTPVLEYRNEPPESEPMDPSYFADALFFGDSRVEGLMLYGTLHDADYIFEKGLNVGNYYEKAIPLDGSDQTVASYIAAQAGRYKDIYLALGINETGWPLEGFINTYRGVIQDVKKHNPNASIYLQSILPVEKRQDSAQYANNKNIQRFNEALATLSLEENLYFIDPSPVLVDASGAVPDGKSGDGVHYNREYVMKWQEYIQSHVAKR